MMQIVRTEFLEDGSKVRYTYEDGSSTIEDVVVAEAVGEPDRLDVIRESQLIIMEALAEQYEESLERDLNNMEAQATMYEAILEMGGNV